MIVRKKMRLSRRAGAICQVCVIVIIFIVTQYLATDEVYYAIIDWSQTPESKPESWTLAIIIFVFLMWLPGIQFFLKYILPILLLKELFDMLR